MPKGLRSGCVLAAAVGGFAVIPTLGVRGLDQAQAQVLETLPVAVFFQANAPDEQTRTLAESLKARDSAIERVTYVSRAQAYAEASNDPLLARSLMLLHDNPFSATAEVQYSAAAWRDRTDPAVTLRQLPGIQDIRWNAQRRDAFLAFEPWKAAVRRMTWGVAIFLMMWALTGIRRVVRQPGRWRAGFLACVIGAAGASAVAGFWAFFLPWHSFAVLSPLFGALAGLGALRGDVC